MSARYSSGEFALLWSVVLGSPLAWAVSLASMFWLTHPVCQGMTHGVIFAAGCSCTAVALAAGIIARHRLRRCADPGRLAGVDSFLLNMAVGMSAIFALVIALSLVPLAMLTPCPV
jgi:hypothetical protein